MFLHSLAQGTSIPLSSLISCHLRIILIKLSGFALFRGMSCHESHVLETACCCTSVRPHTSHYHSLPLLAAEFCPSPVVVQHPAGDVVLAVVLLTVKGVFVGNLLGTQFYWILGEK